MLRARPANGDPNVVAVPEIVGTPVCVVAHGGGLSEVDGVDDAEELEDGGVSGLSVLMIGAEGFGISATESGLRPALPISVAPMGRPIGPTGDPGDAVPAVAAAALPIGAHGPDALAVVPPPATPVPMPPPPELAPMPPPSNVVLPEAPVVALVTAADAAAADNAPPHATPVRGSSGDAPEMMALAPGVASSVAPKGIRVGPTGPAGPMPSGDVMPKGNPGEMLGACACAAPQTNSAATSTIVKRVLMASALFSPNERDGPPGATLKANVISRREPHFARIAAICSILRRFVPFSGPARIGSRDRSALAPPTEPR